MDGRISDNAGLPIVYAVVYTVDIGMMRPIRAMTTTDTDGGYSIGVPLGQEARVTYGDVDEKVVPSGDTVLCLRPILVTPSHRTASWLRIALVAATIASVAVVLAWLLVRE